MGKAFSLISPETGLLIGEEIELSARCFLLGILLCAYVSVKYAFVKLFRLRGTWLFISDFITLAVLSVTVFLFLLKFNFGIMRLYIFFFIFAGAYVFKKTLYLFLQNTVVFILKPIAVMVSALVNLQRKYRKSAM